MRNPKHYTRLLTIAGSDSGGGAGIQADLKTFAALGCFGMSAIAALTAQNTKSVSAIHSVPPEFLAEQLNAVLDDIGTDAIKIGMLATPDLISIVADRLIFFKAQNIVLDPVMVAKSGDKLLQEEAIETLKNILLPISFIITPNLPEATALLNRPILLREDMESAAKEIQSLGANHVLIKGGHLADATSSDLLLTQAGKTYWFESNRIPTQNTHGTGCTYSSAIAAFLGKGFSIENAVAHAKHYIDDAIREGANYQIGKGHGPVHHFHKFWE